MHKDQIIYALWLTTGTIQSHSSSPAIFGIEHKNRLTLENQTALRTARTEIHQPGQCQALDSIKPVERLSSLLSQRLRGRIVWLKRRGNLNLLQGAFPMSAGLLRISLSRLRQGNLFFGLLNDGLETRLGRQP
jgi:hypothetical protein